MVNSKCKRKFGKKNLENKNKNCPHFHPPDQLLIAFQLVYSPFYDLVLIDAQIYTYNLGQAVLRSFTTL